MMIATSLLLAALAVATPDKVQIPPGEAEAKAALEKSPRHGEFVDVPVPDGPALRTWIVYPERKDKAPVVVLIHEIYGLSDWLRAVADQLAADGFIAVAPDFLSGRGPGGGGTESVASRDDVVKLVRETTPEQVAKGLDAVRGWAKSLPAASGKVAVMGFCWGGARTFEAAMADPAWAAAIVYYGTNVTDEAKLASVKTPLLGLYGSDDARVNATVPDAKAALDRLGRTYEVETYEGAGHGFLRAQDGREGANRRAAEAAWARTLAFLRQHAR